MKHIIKVTFLLLLNLSIACKNESKQDNSVSVPENEEELNFAGNYASEDYSQRSDGYDWVAVLVTETDSEQLNISIRSRADKKKPTCTFDAIAKKVNDSTYQAEADGKSILFEFSNAQINISAPEKGDDSVLYFYCSGGADIGGNYMKLKEPLDQKQIDRTKFSRVLNLQDVGFNVSSMEQDGENTLTIFTFGLKESEYHESFSIGGQKVINAEVGDLNSDGSPELFVFTQSVSNDNYGKVYAFSVNNKRSLSQVYFPPTEENSQINKGYSGHDEFSLVENTLGQRFPIYKEGDKTESTGKTRQVSYKLVEGEAMRKLEIDTITEY